MDPRMVPKGSSTEYNYGEQDGKARPNNPGVYFHPQAQKFVETTGVERPDGSVSYASAEGKIQGDAFKQIGYREASPEEAAGFRAAKQAAAKIHNIRKTRTTHVMSARGRS